MNIAAILKNIDSNTLSEETATSIAEAFNAAVDEKAKNQISLEVEKALKEQDEDHAGKLKNLLEAIDKDHAQKLQQVVEAINSNHAVKLESLVSYYRKAINEKAEKFSNKIVEEMSNYLDLYLDKIVPQDQLQEAVANTSARVQLEQIKKLLALDPGTINENVKKVVVTGKRRIDELESQLQESHQEKLQLNEQLKNFKASLLLEQKTKGMSSTKKDFISKILNDKSPSYIEENFNYVVQMFEREDRNLTNNIAEVAAKTAISKDAKVPTQTINESTTKTSQSSPVDFYVSALKGVR